MLDHCLSAPKGLGPDIEFCILHAGVCMRIFLLYLTVLTLIIHRDTCVIFNEVGVE